MNRSPAASSLLLGLAAAGLFLAALDAYAVVTLLPQMMTATGLPVDQIQSATPIVSGFLGGYVVAMPLLGAYSDARGRLPVYAGSLALFGLGSALTALSGSLAQLVAGRALQGLGGGALVPLSLALAADLYREAARGLAVGAVSALQEAGSVVGPVYGAGVAAVLGGWQAVFWLNLPLAAAILLGIALVARRQATPAAPVARQVDWTGAALLGAGLGLALLALYPDDPQRNPINTRALPLGLAAAAVLVAFGWRQGHRLTPLIAPGLLRRPAFGASLATNLVIGIALMVALVDVPLVGRGVFDLDALRSGLLLTRFLAGVPVGAVLGGWLAGRASRRAVAATGLLLAGCTFALMSTWSVDQLARSGASATAELFFCGLGLGLVIAPLSVTVLDLARGLQHGLASSLVVLSRTVGMALGLAALTAFGLARFQRILAARPCTIRPTGSLGAELGAYEACVRQALLLEYREIFWIAAGLSVLAALMALLSLPGGRAAGAAAPG